MTSDNIKFKKIKLFSRQLTVSYDEINADENGIVITNQVSKKCEQLCHEELLDAFRRLVPHFAILSEVRSLPEPYIDGEPVFNEAAINEIFKDTCRATGLHINDSSSGETVIISGVKYTKHSCVCFDAPQVSTADTMYPYLAELFEAVEHVKSEVFAYLFEGKCAVKQAELFDDSLDATNPTVSDVEPEKPVAKRRNRKLTVTVESQPLAS